MHPSVLAVHLRATHEFTKQPVSELELLAGLGVKGDAHCGKTVKHRSRVAKDPTQPNLRQVHLIHHELLLELRAAGFDVGAGQLGENITTVGIDILGLSAGTRLKIGQDAVLRVTGLRNPCAQIEAFLPGLLKEVLGRDENGKVLRKAGVMCVVETEGLVRATDMITVIEKPLVPVKLEPV